MANCQLSPAKPARRNAVPSRRGPAPEDPAARRRRSIPFRMLADAFATVDEELEAEPDWADFARWSPSR